MLNWGNVRAELQKPLDPKHVKDPPKGKYGQYVDGYHVISEANRIFGENGWSYEIRDMRQVCRIEAKDRSGNRQIRVGYYCSVKVLIDGTSFKEGAAVGSGMARPENEADAHESAVKEAETDALKRALRSYGNTFGLALYDKDQANVQAPRDPRKIADALINSIKAKTTGGGLHKFKTSDKFTAARDWLETEKPAMCAEVDVAMSSREQELDPAHQSPPTDEGN